MFVHCGVCLWSYDTVARLDLDSLLASKLLRLFFFFHVLSRSWIIGPDVSVLKAALIYFLQKKEELCAALRVDNPDAAGDHSRGWEDSLFISLLSWIYTAEILEFPIKYLNISFALLPFSKLQLIIGSYTQNRSYQSISLVFIFSQLFQTLSYIMISSLMTFIIYSSCYSVSASLFSLIQSRGIGTVPFLPVSFSNINPDIFLSELHICACFHS